MSFIPVSHAQNKAGEGLSCSLSALVNLPVMSTPLLGQETLEPSSESAEPLCWESLHHLQGSLLSEYARQYQNPAPASHLYFWKTPNTKIKTVSYNHQQPGLLFCIRTPRELPEEQIKQHISHTPWISLVSHLITGTSVQNTKGAEHFRTVLITQKYGSSIAQMGKGSKCINWFPLKKRARLRQAELDWSLNFQRGTPSTQSYRGKREKSLHLFLQWPGWMTAGLDHPGQALSWSCLCF